MGKKIKSPNPFKKSGEIITSPFKKSGEFSGKLISNTTYIILFGIGIVVVLALLYFVFTRRR